MTRALLAQARESQARAPHLTSHAHPMVRRGVRLDVNWESRRDTFRSSLSALLHGPAPPRGWPLGKYFRDTWLRRPPPWKPLGLSFSWHILAVVFPIWIVSTGRGPAPPPPKSYEITWRGPIRDLLPYLPSGPKSKMRMRGERAKQRAAKGADAYHPRQTIISAPPKITHPRQTLIQPDVPPVAPKILPALPNVAQWIPTPQPPQRRLRVNTRALVRTRQRTARPVESAPEVQKTPAVPADFTLAKAEPALVAPKLEVRRTARPEFRTPASEQLAAAAPDVAPSPMADAGAQRLVALSAFPAPPPPNLEVPQGNLAAKFAISPDGKQPGEPGGAAAGSGSSTVGADAGLGAGNGAGTLGGGGKGPGIPGVSISGGNPANSSTISGSGSGLIASLRTRLKPLPVAPDPRPDSAAATRSRPETLLDRIKPGAPPEDILDPGRIYTLHVNMPNLSSVTGSWVLKFTELEEEERKAAALESTPELAGPVPLRKVDPKYPPALISARIQGEVVLYAIIRSDGSVDSIQLVQGLDPRLDENAMEALAKWKFRAAERKGRPVELETIVRIPFHAMSAAY